MASQAAKRHIRRRLRDVYTAEGVDIWIHGRNRDLGGKPIDLLVAGQFKCGFA